MKIRFLVPEPVGSAAFVGAELRRKSALLKEWICPPTDVDIAAVRRKPCCFWGACDADLDLADTARAVLQAEADGCSAVVLSCFHQPGLAGLREVTKVPLIGPATSSVNIAMLTGVPFSILTPDDGVADYLTKIVQTSGGLDRFAGVRTMGIRGDDFVIDPKASMQRILQTAERAIMKDGARVLVLGCTVLGFFCVAEQLAQRLQIPVLNPVKMSLKTAEAVVANSLTFTGPAPYSLWTAPSDIGFRVRSRLTLGFAT